MEATQKKEPKVWTEETIVALLMRNNKAVEKAIVAIYDRQTQDEKASQDTKHTNNVGFSGADASSGSYYAKWVLSGRHLSGKHLDRARKMACKYRKQLLTIAQDKAQQPTSAVKQVEVAIDEEGSFTSTGVCNCDVCGITGKGLLHHLRGTPVYFQCHLCGGTRE